MPEWVPPVAFGLLVTLIGVIYRAIDKRFEKHEERLEKIEGRPANGHALLEQRVVSIEHELGDRNRGIRGLLHDHSGYHAENDGRFLRIEEKLSLIPWMRKKRRHDD